MSFIFIAGCASQKEAEHPSGLVIHEIKPDKLTALTTQNLLHLSQVYDLSPYFFTKKIYIENRPLSASHPVLTLNTRHSEKPNRLLAQFLHEELHWWVGKKSKEVELAVSDLKKIYPKAPAAKNQTAHDTYVHLIICYLELRATTHYLGSKEARGILSHTMQKDKFLPWVYNQVLYKEKGIKAIVEKHHLLPPH